MLARTPPEQRAVLAKLETVIDPSNSWKAYRVALREHGLPEKHIETECRCTVDHFIVARDCLAAAREAECSTIAIGRETLPWYRELLHRHAGDLLVRHAEGFTVWVIE